MLQSTILYKVSDPGGVPLDRNGVPTIVSGARQAIALLEGTANPNPVKYDVVGIFSLGQMIEGVKTFKVDETCDAVHIQVNPDRIDISNGAQVLQLLSGSAWTAQSVNFANFSPSSGPAGGFELQVTPGAAVGQGLVTFTNQEGRTDQVYIINLPGALWILETGTWNNNGKWTAAGLWKY